MIKISDEAIERIADDIASRIKGEWQIEDGFEPFTLGHEKFWDDFIKRVDPHEKKYTEVIRKLLQKQANEVFENIKRHPKNPKRWIFNKKQSLRELTDAEAKFITKLIKQEGQKAIDLALKLAKVQKGLKVSPAVGITFDIENPLVIETLTKQTTRFPAGLVNTTEEEIRGAIAAGTREGENVEKLADRVQEKLGPSSITNRAMLIARTETMYAANAGAELGYVQSGVVEGKQWLIAWDERTCDICLDMEGMTSPVGEPTWEKEGLNIGDVQSRYGLTFDYTEGEMPFPPIHPRCRCTLIPILKQVKGFTPSKTQLKEITKFNKAYTKAPIEHSLVVDQKGKILLNKSGGKNYVNYTEAEVNKFIGVDNIIFTHNHPTGNSFSFQDINFMTAINRNNNMTEMRVIGQKYQYSLRIIDNTKIPVSPAAMREAYTGVNTRLQDFYQAIYDKKRGEILASGVHDVQAKINAMANQVSIIHTNATLEVFSKRYGFEYKRWLYK